MDQGQAVEQPSVEERLANYFSEEAPQQEEQQQQPEEQVEEVNVAEEPKEQVTEETITIDPEAPMFDVTIKLEGGQNETKKVSLKDLESGYMMQADYQRKTAELARAREQLAVEAQQIIEPERQQYIQNLGVLQQAVMALGASDLQSVDWEKLSVEDPAKFVQLSAKAQKVQQTLGTIAQQQQMAQQKAFQEAAANSRRVLTDPIQGIPDFEAVYPKLINETSKMYGFRPEEVAQVVDHRMIKVLDDARKYRELQAAKPTVEKKVAAVPKVLKPGKPGEASDSQAKKVSELRAQARKSGDLRDAARAYEAILTGKR